MFEYQNQKFDLATVQGWADEVNMTVDDYVAKYDITRLPDQDSEGVYNYNGKNYDISTVKKWASEVNMDVEEYAKKYNLPDVSRNEEFAPTWLENTFGKDTFGVDFVSDMYRAWNSGWRQASAMGEIADVAAGDYSDKALDIMRDKLKYSREAGQSDEMQAYQKAVEKYKKEGSSGFMAGLYAFLENPSIGPEVMLSSASMLVSTALEGDKVTGFVAAGTATGAGIGAAATSYGLGIGAIPGGVAGAQGAAMTAMEGLGTFAEILQEKVEEGGGSFSNNDDLRKVLDDPEEYADIFRRAIGRGVSIGLIEAMTGGIAGKIGAGAKGLIGLQKVPKLAKALAVEVGGGMVGETTGMLAAGQELKGEEILLEGIAGGPTAFVQSSLQAAGLGDPEYKVNGRKVKPRAGKKVIKDMVENSTDEEFAGLRVKIKNDPKLSEEVQNRRKKIISENKSVLKEKAQPESVSDLNKELDLEIKKAENKLKQVQKTDGGIAAEIFEERIKELKEKKKNLNNLVSFQIDQLNEEETLALMNIDDNVSLYQSILNDPDSTELAKDAAKQELAKLKSTQISILDNPQAVDMAREDGPRTQKNKDLSDKTQKAYKAKGKNSWSDVAKHQAGLINSIATSMWSKVAPDKRVGTIDDFITGLKTDKEGIYGLVRTYNPDTGVPLAAYIANRKSGLPARANRIIKKYTKQDTQKPIGDLLKTAYAEEANMNIELDSRANHEKLGIGDLIGDLENDTEIALQKVENDLKLLGEVTQRKRQEEALKSFNDVFDFKYSDKIKKFIGKNTKTKDDFSKFLKKNLPLLKSIALRNVKFQMGSSLISKSWNEVTPSDKEFLDYYEGADSPSSQTLSDRKTRLIKAITDQLGTDARESYFENRQEQRELFNKQQGISFQQDGVTSQSLQNMINDLDTVLGGVNTWAVEENDVQEIYDELQAIDEMEANFKITPDSKARREELQEQLNEKLKPVDDEAINKAVDKVIQEEVISEIDHDNTEKITVKNNKEKVINELESNIKKGYIAPNHLKKIGNFGAETAYKGRDGKFYSKEGDAYIGAPKYYVMKEPVQDSESVYLPYDMSHLDNDLYKGKFKATRGGLYYGQKDPLFVEHIKLAEKNYKGKIINEQPNLNLFTKTTNIIVNKMVSLPVLKKLVDNHKSKVKTNQDIVIQMTEDFSNAVKEGANPWVMSLMLKSAYRGTTGLIKSSYEFKGYESGKLEFGKSLKYTKGYKNNADRMVREEHSPPVSIFAAKLFKVAVTSNDIRATIEKMYKDAGQYLISFKHDEILDTNKLAANIVSGSVIGRGSGLVRIIEAVPANKLSLISNNKSIADLYSELKDIKNNKTLQEYLLSLNDEQRQIQIGLQFQQDNLENFELTNNERLEALIDILQSQYNDKIVMTDKADVIKYLMANYGYTKKDATDAINQKGFRDPDIIYINLEKAGLDTPMHEFTHEWAEIVYKKDPDLFNAIYEKLRNHPRFAEAISRMDTPGIGKYNEMIVDSFNYKNEVMAYILGEEGASLYELFEGDAEAKTLIDKFFDYVREALGFDPTVKNFSDLTVNEVIKLSVKDIIEGNPAANFDKLKNKSEGKSWFTKTEANESPSTRAKLNPVLRAFNKLKLTYRKEKNLAKAVNEAYKEVQGIMEFEEFVKLALENTKETNVGKSKTLLIAKDNVITANKIAETSVKKIEEQKIKEENKSDLQNKFRRMIYKAAGEGSKVSRWFIPPSAEDFKGLLYTFLPKGQAGVEARKFLEENLLKPYSDGIAALDTEILNKSKAWEKMSKGYKFNDKVKGTPYTIGDAIKVYNAIQRGDVVNISKQKHMDALIHAVESDQALLDIAEAIEESFPIDVKDGWQNKTLAKEIFDVINNGARDRALTTFNENVDAIFNDTTMDLIGDQFGLKFKQALKNTLRRMKSGRNRVSTDAQSNVWLNWINRAVGTTMFFNSRSALLQTISSLNFIGLKDNNIFKAAAAYANTKQFNEDYKKLWNSDYLRNRRDGAKFDVLADEIAEGDPQGINKLLKNGFLPTRYADSFAIALGGAAFYRNRVNALVKGGMDVAQAEEQAMNDWRMEAENSQQSADPSKISEIQASSLGRIIYAFANTPFQYARIVKRRLQDITSGRSAAEGRVQSDLGTILYYGAVQAVMFNALQSGLAALAFGDPDDEELKELKDKKYLMSIERGLTSFAKSLGNPGAVTATLYSLLKEGYLQQTGQKRPDPNVFAITATSISPPINSKLRDLSSAYRAFNKIDEEDLLTPSLDSEALTFAGEVASFTGVPLDRVIRKARHLAAIKNEELEVWQRIWLLLGWNEWDLGVDTRVDKNLFKEAKFDDDSFKEAEFKESSFKKLKPGVAGVANNDGTIELAPDLSPEEKKKTIQHEKQHLLDMKNKKIKLNYDDNFVYYKDKKYKRVNGNIEYNGKSYTEGHPELPWEKRAYKAEKTRKFLYA